MQFLGELLSAADRGDDHIGQAGEL